ncbi:MAG: Riboflavin transporter [Alphaproteobacteria bacterium MarineAlpha5_Bin11]|nr:MAG: Riboflavin transporter [Alphaproteobacteria bacterium MarineAlpha5_Bin11]PPR51477.1 MAG: Riboflavin transporter [Alphaproteobacteria bacterium MarineAlpha5_Bin10]
MIVGMFCLSVNDVNVKWLSQKYPVWELVFFRAISGMIISLGLVMKFGTKTLKTQKPIAHIIRAISAVGCVVFYFFGLKFLMLSENNALAHSGPIIATVLAVPFLGEKLGIRRLLAVLLGFIGVLVIVQPGTDVFKIYSLLPIISAIFMAFSYLSLRFIMKTDSSISIIFYYSLALLITTIIFFPSDFEFPTYINLIPLFSLGVMGSLGHYFMSQAAKRADTAVITPFEYSAFLWVIILGYFFLGEIPNKTVILGGVLIVISGIYIIYRENNNTDKKNI